jgi:endonuclease/exonuclease/phosphatase family metal-dependent hydrolase
MKTHQVHLTTALGAVLVTVLSLGGAVRGQSYDVQVGGSFAPTGGFTLPAGGPALFPYLETYIPKARHSLVKAAMLDPSFDDDILISAGDYWETGVFDSPAVLSAPGGDVVLGRQDAANSTTFSLATWNLHLAGDTSALPGATWDYWQDGWRAEFAATKCFENQWDVVAFSELWDEDYFCGDCGINTSPDEDDMPTPMIEVAGYLDGEIGDDHDNDGLHSGLALMSQYTLHDFVQKEFEECPGNPCDDEDCLANKGFVSARIQKETFDIWIINTHMQADTGLYENILTRQEQMFCINLFVELRMSENPSDVFFIVGDLNVPGDYHEYYNIMRSSFPRFNDGARNVPGFVESEQYTNSDDNELAMCFDCATQKNRFDYILYSRESWDGTVKVAPRTTSAIQLLGPVSLLDDCDECPDADLWTKELSDHWAVTGEYEIFRP